jgi:hypothetical protein
LFDNIASNYIGASADRDHHHETLRDTICTGHANQFFSAGIRDDIDARRVSRCATCRLTNSARRSPPPRAQALSAPAGRR